MEGERECSPHDLFDLVKTQKNNEAVTLLLDIFCTDLFPSSPYKSRFKLTYRFLNMNTHARPHFVVTINEGTIVDTLSPLWPNASCYEMEIYDLFGIKFSRTYTRIFTKNTLTGFPLRKDFSSKKQDNHYLQENEQNDDWYYWYPLYPYNKGAMLFKLKMKGEMIIESDATPGYSHRGIEKILEHIPYHKAFPLMERLDTDTSLTYSLLWVKAVEELCHIDIPKRAKALRMVFLEIGRIYSHIFSIDQMMIHFGLISFNLPFFQFRKEVETLFNDYKKTKYFSNIAEIGGLKDVDLQWINKCMKFLENLQDHLKIIEGMCSHDQDWMKKLEHFRIDPSFAIEWGYSGPYLRSLGLNYDIRKASPYYFYKDVDFEIPLGIYNTGYDHYLVKIEEVRQSIKIISQILNNLPDGESMRKDISFFFEDTHSKEDFFKHVTRGLNAYKGEVYSFLEGPCGEVGIYLMSTGDNRPYRVRLRSPHYPILFSYNELFKQKTIQEIDDILNCFSLSMAEIDR